jgi:hypothetical protein
MKETVGVSFRAGMAAGKDRRNHIGAVENMTTPNRT